MIDAKFVPISEWIGPKTESYRRKSATFRATYVQTLDLLETELNHLRAKDILIQAYLKREDIRNDGWPRAGARPTSPGVIVTFEVKTSGRQFTMSFPCDRFDRWEDNLRAVAKSLEALRMVDRYGVTRNNEQYTGFAALPPADPSTAKNAAIEFLARMSGWPIDRARSDQSGAYRAAAAILHPDHEGGSHDRFVELQAHWKVLGL
jgi:hypothetical protein